MAKKNSSGKGVGPTIMDVQMHMEKRIQKDSSKPRLKKIGALLKSAPDSDDPIETLYDAGELISREFRRSALNEYKGRAYYAAKAIENGKIIIKKKKAFYSTPKENRQGVKWSEVRGHFFKHVEPWTLQEWKRLADTPDVHEYAVIGYWLIREMRRLHKRVGKSKFAKFIQKHNLSIKDNLNVPLEVFKNRLIDVLIAEGHIKGPKTGGSTDDDSDEGKNSKGKESQGKKPKGTDKEVAKRKKRKNKNEDGGADTEKNDPADGDIKDDDSAINDRIVDLWSDLKRKRVVKELDSDALKYLKKLKVRIGKILNQET